MFHLLIIFSICSSLLLSFLFFVFVCVCILSKCLFCFCNPLAAGMNLYFLPVNHLAVVVAKMSERDGILPLRFATACLQGKLQLGNRDMLLGNRNAFSVFTHPPTRQLYNIMCELCINTKLLCPGPSSSFLDK